MNRINLITLIVSICVCMSSCDKDNEENVNNSNAPEWADAVDLGLSVKWASCNIGASSPEDVGNYYSWGETTSKKTFTMDSYKYYDPNKNWYSNIGTEIAGTKYDTAKSEWGGKWRMPTISQWAELVNKCEWTYTRYGDYRGFLITGKNNNSIFLPLCGGYEDNELFNTNMAIYWSSSADSEVCDDGYSYAWVIEAYTDGWINLDDGEFKDCGYPIRAVYEN